MIDHNKRNIVRVDVSTYSYALKVIAFRNAMVAQLFASGAITSVIIIIIIIIILW